MNFRITTSTVTFDLNTTDNNVNVNKQSDLLKNQAPQTAQTYFHVSNTYLATT